MTENQTNRVSEVLNASGLNWGVRTEAITTESGIEIPGNVALIRDDNNKVLSVCGKAYHPYQNEQLVELLDRVSSQVGLPIHRAGYFGDGQKVYIQLKSDNMTLGTDRVEGYITGVNSFDGSTSLAFGPSNVTISCQNKFFAAFKQLNAKVRHTKNMGLKIDEICMGLENVLAEERMLFNDIKELSEYDIKAGDKDWVTKLLFNIAKDVNLNDAEAVSTVTRNKMERWYIDLNGELKDKGQNMWGLFSGVTKYTTHSMGKGDNDENKMFGTYGQRERQVFNKMVELVH
jgi:hypothetical protein